MSEEKRKRGRPPTGKTIKTKEALKREKKAEENEVISDARKQVELITQKFIDNPKPFFEEREEEIAKVIEKYGDLQSQDLEDGVVSKKDYSLKLSEYVMKPLVPAFASTAKLHTPNSILAVNDFYWNKIVLPFTDKLNFIPNIHDLLGLLNISSTTFARYATNEDEAMREACQIIKDKFISYYQRRGLAKEIDTIMAMFVLKTSFQQRENDAPQIVVANINNSPQEKIDKYARQYGFEKWKEVE